MIFDVGPGSAGGSGPSVSERVRSLEGAVLLLQSGSSIRPSHLVVQSKL